MSDEAAKGGIKDAIQQAMIAAMRAQDKVRLGIIRLIQNDIKRREIDERVTLSNDEVIDVLQKMVRQRRESIQQFEKGNRPDLVEKEVFEIEVIQHFLPQSLPLAELEKYVQEAIREVDAKSVKDISKVMAILKPKLHGRADMGEVGGLIKKHLSS